MKKKLISGATSLWSDSLLPKFIYGTGSVGREVFQMLSANGIFPIGYMDHIVKNLPVIGKFPIYTPDMISEENRRETIVFLAIHNREARIDKIIERLKYLGYIHIFTLFDLYDLFSEELGSHYWLAPRSVYSQFQDEISQTLGLLADEKSRNIYNAIINFRTTGNYAILPIPDLENQYFPDDIPAWKTPLRLMDCGAYDGDTLNKIKTMGISIDAVAAYEPDMANFLKLATNTKKIKFPDVYLWPCGVYSNCSQMHFTSGQNEASQISDRGETILQCVSLDESAPNFAPTLIKMDIEGSEMEALQGARNLIAEYHPGLAISIYHTPEHLWEIPLFINELSRKSQRRYDYYVRSHGFNTFETVFYAVPK